MSAAPPRVLITDDEKDCRWVLSTLLRQAGFDPVEAESGPRAVQRLRSEAVDVMLLDLRMPGWDGLETLREARRAGADVPVVMLTGYGSIPSAVEAVRAGASAYLTKPFHNDDVLAAVRDALAGRQKPPADAPGSPDWLGNSPALRRASAAVARVAPTDFTVLLVGETGTGKEVAARELHRLSRRAGGPFVPVDCGAIPATLLESELFGHERGAFTGADRARAGCFESARGGTLFLDEVGNLPLPLQAKLLRVLQERQVRRVGGPVPLDLDVRVVAATNAGLPRMIAAGEFRRDLFHRLDEFRVELPPLRDRGDDVLTLAEHFRAEACAELAKRVPPFGPGVCGALRRHDWPGNVRELRNAVRRAVLMADGPVTPELLGLSPGPGEPAPEVAAAAPLEDGVSFKEQVRRRTEAAERDILARALRRTNGNKARAARLLQLDDKTVRTKVKEYGLPGPGGGDGDGEP